MQLHSSADDDYRTAVAALLSPAHQATTPSEIRAASARRRNTLRDMHAYLQRLGLDLNGGVVDGQQRGGASGVPQLIFHVTGTKGKGSTLSLCESILRRAHGLNTGMFTSPHLVSIRERIRINGAPVSRKAFGQVYWAVRRKLESHEAGGNDPSGGEDSMQPLPALPGYFRMLTLMALYAFCNYQNPKLDVILLEVGMGGRYDATNLFEPSDDHSSRLLVRGCTLIDFDHVRVLGSTLTQIAWEKGGIYVQNKLDNIGMDDGGYDSFAIDVEKCIASSNQEVFVSGKNTDDVLAVLKCIAGSNGCDLRVVHDSSVGFADIGLQGDHQRSNAALAIAMCEHAAARCEKIKSAASRDDIRDACAQTFWPGRCHTVHLPAKLMSGRSQGVQGAPPEPSLNLRCDGAHTPISINACIEWFRTVSAASWAQGAVRRVLVFNCGHERNPIPLVSSLCHSDLFDSVYFCKADFERPSAVPKVLDDEWLKEAISVGGLSEFTLESMCRDLSKDADSSTVDRHQLDQAELSASTWQETLANVWSVLDMHRRRNVVDEDSLQRTPPKVTTGLTVKEALSDIREGAASEMVDASADAGSVLIEVCVTGSLYIVGSALEAVGWEEGEASGDVVIS